jgi:hypothetical protein
MGFLGLKVETANQGWAELPSQLAPLPATAGPTVSVASVQPPTGTATEQAVWVRCPQERDCPDGGLASRIFECQEGCGFRGCAACMEIHEAEPHADDSATLLEMVRSAGGSW